MVLHKIPSYFFYVTKQKNVGDTLICVASIFNIKQKRTPEGVLFHSFNYQIRIYS